MIYTYERIDRALESVDDSTGFRFESLNILASVLQHNLQKCSWSKAQIAEFLFKHWRQPIVDLLPTIPQDFADVLTAEGMQHFVSLCTKKLQTMLPPAQKKKNGETVDWHYQYQYRQFNDILIQHARKNQRPDQVIALMAGAAVNISDYLDIANFCLQHNKPSQSIEWLNKAKIAAKHQRDEHPSFVDQEAISEQEIAIINYQQDYQKVFDMRWQQFRKDANLKRYKQLKAAAKNVNYNYKVYDKAMQHLEGFKQKSKEFEKINVFTCIAEIQLHEQQHIAALQTAKQCKLHPQTLHRIAKTQLADIEQSLPLYIRLAKAEINQVGKSHYIIACRYLRELKEAHNPQNIPEQLTLAVIALAIENSKRPSFIAELQKLFPDVDFKAKIQQTHKTIKK